MDEVDTDVSLLSDDDIDDLEDLQVLEGMEDRNDLIPPPRTHILDRTNPLEAVSSKHFLWVKLIIINWDLKISHAMFIN